MGVYDDLATSELYVNPDGSVWAVVRGRGHRATGLRLPPTTVEAFLNVAAARQGRTVTRRDPGIDGELPRPVFGGARLQGVIPPVTDAPTFHARKRPTDVVPLTTYRDDGTMSRAHFDVLHDAVVRGDTIVVGGSTGSGKSFLLNSLIEHQVRHLEDPHVPFFVIEDTVEVVCNALNRTQMRTTPECGFDTLLFWALRMTPRFLHLNECRRAALQMLEMWSTGHPGYCTVHADDAEGLLERVGRLARRDSGRSEGWLVARAIQFVVMIRGTAGGREVHEVVRVRGFRRGRYLLEPL
jgi:type IV secretion system protein VirB11